MSDSPTATTRYRVSLVTCLSYTIYVDAADEDDALEMAYEAAPAEVQSLRGHGDPGYLDVAEWSTDGFSSAGGTVEVAE